MGELVLLHHGFSGLVSAFDGGTDNELVGSSVPGVRLFTWNILAVIM
jgi:hypothetical protein